MKQRSKKVSQHEKLVKKLETMIVRKFSCKTARCFRKHSQKLHTAVKAVEKKLGRNRFNNVWRKAKHRAWQKL